MRITINPNKPEVRIETEKSVSTIYKFGHTYKIETDHEHDRSDLRIIGNYLESTEYFKNNNLLDAKNIEKYLIENLDRLDKKYLHGLKFRNDFYLKLINRGKLIKFVTGKSANHVVEMAKKQGWYSDFDSKLWSNNEFKINLT